MLPIGKHFTLLELYSSYVFRFLLTNDLYYELPLFYPQQFINVNFKKFRNLNECLHWGLADICAPLAYSCWRTAHLLCEPLVCFLLIYKNDFYFILHCLFSCGYLNKIRLQMVDFSVPFCINRLVQNV